MPAKTRRPRSRIARSVALAGVITVALALVAAWERHAIVTLAGEGLRLVRDGVKDGRGLVLVIVLATIVGWFTFAILFPRSSATLLGKPSPEEGSDRVGHRFRLTNRMLLCSFLAIPAVLTFAVIALRAPTVREASAPIDERSVAAGKSAGTVALGAPLVTQDRAFSVRPVDVGSNDVEGSPPPGQPEIDEVIARYRQKVQAQELRQASECWAVLEGWRLPPADLPNEERGDHLFLLLQYDEAVERYRLASAARRSPSVTTKLVLALVAKRYSQDPFGDAQEAVGLGEGVVRELRGVENATDLARALQALGVARLSAGQLGLAEQDLLEAARKCQSAGVVDADLLAHIFNTLATVNDQTGRSPQADEFFRKADEMIQRKFPGDSAPRAIMLTNRAVSLRRQGRPREAESLYATGLAMMCRVCRSPENPQAADSDLRVANIRAGYALVLTDLKKLAEAEECARSACRGFVTTVGEDRIDVAHAEGILAEVLMLRGEKWDEAERLAKSGLSKLVAVLPGDSPAVGLAMSNLAVQLANRCTFEKRPESDDDRTEIDRLLTQSVEMLRRVNARPELAWAMRNLGSRINQQGQRARDLAQTKRGVTMVDDARKILTDLSQGRPTMELAECTYALAMAHKRANEYLEAAEFSSSAAAMFNTVLQAESAREALCWSLVARCTVELQRNAEATAAADRGVAMAERSTPVTDPIRKECEAVRDLVKRRLAARPVAGTARESGLVQENPQPEG